MPQTITTGYKALVEAAEREIETLPPEEAVRLSGRELAGTFEGLDDAGHLLLRDVDGRLQTITAGDIFPVATALAPVVNMLRPGAKGQGK